MVKSTTGRLSTDLAAAEGVPVRSETSWSRRRLARWIPSKRLQTSRRASSGRIAQRSWVRSSSPGFSSPHSRGPILRRKSVGRSTCTWTSFPRSSHRARSRPFSPRQGSTRPGSASLTSTWHTFRTSSGARSSGTRHARRLSGVSGRCRLPCPRIRADVHARASHPPRPPRLPPAAHRYPRAIPRTHDRTQSTSRAWAAGAGLFTSSLTASLHSAPHAYRPHDRETPRLKTRMSSCVGEDLPRPLRGSCGLSARPLEW